MVPPILSTAQPPAVSAVTGLGTGGGAGVQSQLAPSDGQGAGQVLVRAGQDAALGGSVTLAYPQTPPTMFYAPSEAFQDFAVAGQGTSTHTLSWTNALSPNQVHAIAYQWSVSQ
jgi:hypothetical protein